MISTYDLSYLSYATAEAPKFSGQDLGVTLEIHPEFNHFSPINLYLSPGIWWWSPQRSACFLPCPCIMFSSQQSELSFYGLGQLYINPLITWRWVTRGNCFRIVPIFTGSVAPDMYSFWGVQFSSSFLDFLTASSCRKILLLAFLTQNQPDLDFALGLFLQHPRPFCQLHYLL